MSRSALKLVDTDGNTLLYIKPDEVVDLYAFFSEGHVSSISSEFQEVLEDELGS